MIHSSSNQAAKPQSFEVRVLRQDEPQSRSYWQRFQVPYEPEMNVISVLQRIASIAQTMDRQKTTPVAWDCNCLEEVCGACTMVINGRVRQACSALVDRLLEDDGREIELRPMSKFPVVRDLVVDRARLFQALERVHAWINVDGYYDKGPGPRQSQDAQEANYPLSQCMSCGCCLDACPQYLKIELAPRADESDEAFAARKRQAHSTGFLGAHAISQVMLFNNHPTGKMNARERLDALEAPGGLQVCGNAQNCVAVCPKSIPLTRSIAQAGRATTIHVIKKWLEK